MEIKKVMVIGAGQMGAGIAQVCVQSGFEVYFSHMVLLPKLVDSKLLMCGAF